MYASLGDLKGPFLLVSPDTKKYFAAGMCFYDRGRDKANELQPITNSDNLSKFLPLSGEPYQKAQDGPGGTHEGSVNLN